MGPVFSPLAGLIFHVSTWDEKHQLVTFIYFFFQRVTRVCNKKPERTEHIIMSLCSCIVSPDRRLVPQTGAALVLIVSGDSHILTMNWSSFGFAAWSLLSLAFNTKLIRTWREQSHSDDQRHRLLHVCVCYIPPLKYWTHTHTLSTCDWQQCSIRSLLRTRASREAFTESYQSSTWWHAYFRLPFSTSTLPLLTFLFSTPPLPCFPPSHFLIITVRNDTLCACLVNIPQPWTHLQSGSLPPALKCPLKYR